MAVRRVVERIITAMASLCHSLVFGDDGRIRLIWDWAWRRVMASGW